METIFEPVKRVVILFCALSGIAQVVQANECTFSDAAGRYGYTSSGSIVNPAVGPFTAVGHVTFTDSGTLDGAQTTSIAGNLIDETLQGTYTVNPDCTGSATVSIYRGSTLARTSKINIVWDMRQNEARAIFLTPGTSITLQARKMAQED